MLFAPVVIGVLLMLGGSASASAPGRSSSAGTAVWSPELASGDAPVMALASALGAKWVVQGRAHTAPSTSPNVASAGRIRLRLRRTVVQGSTQTVRWTLSRAVRGGRFRLSLRNAAGRYVRLTPSGVEAVAARTSYSWTWAVTQPPVTDGMLRLRYYSAAGAPIATVRRPVTVLSAQPVLTWPAGGEQVVQGSTQTVRWTMPNPVGDGRFEVWLRTAAGIYVPLSSGVPAVAGQSSYSWTWAVTQDSVSDGALSLRYYNRSGAPVATIERPVTVLSAQPVLTWPTGGEQVVQGSTQTVRWTMPNPVGDGRFEVWLRDAAGIFVPLSSGVPAVAGQSSYSWTWAVTQPPVPGGMLRLRYFNTSGTGIATAEKAVSVVAPPPPVLAVTVPNGGEVFTKDADVTARWTLSRAVDSGSFRLTAVSPTVGSHDLNGEQIPARSGATSYTFSWTVAQPAADDYRLRVSYLDGPGRTVASDESDGAFAVAPPVTDSRDGDLAVVGKYAYIAAGVDGLRIVDVSDPQAPVEVGGCDTPGSAKDVSVCGSHAYVADGDGGLQVVDVSDPVHPAIVASRRLPGPAHRLSFSAGRVAADFESTAGFAVSNGTMAVDAAHVKHGAASVKLSVAAGTTATLTRDDLDWDLSHERGALQLWVYMKTTGAPAGSYDRSLILTLLLSNANDTANYFSTGSNYYVHDGWNLLRFSAADWQATGSPSWSRPIQRLRFVLSAPSDRAEELSFDELRAGERGVLPAFLWTFDDGYDELHQDVLPYLAPRGQRATVYLTSSFVGGATTLSLAHLRDLYAAGWALGNHSVDHTDLSSVDQATAAEQIRGCTDWLIAHGFPRAAYHMAYPYNNSSASARAAATQCGILSARRHGFRNQQVPVDDALMLNSFGVEDADPTIDAWRAKIDRAIAGGGTLIFYGHSFTSTNLPLFKQIADYVAERRLWTPPIDEWWNTLAMQGAAGEMSAGLYLYVACGDAGVQVVDVSDPLAPVLMGRCTTGGAAEDAVAYDGGACVAAGSAGLRLVDAQQPATPVLAGGLAGGTAPSQGICVRGQTAYVAAGADGLRIVSIADPAHPAQLGVLDTPGDARDVTVVGSTAYVADGAGGLRVIDVSDPTRPALVDAYSLASPAAALVVFGRTAYVSDGHGGLEIVPLDAG